MPRDPGKAAEAFQRKLAKREQNQGGELADRHSVPGWLEKAADWPLLEVLLARKWDEQMALAGILIARYSLQGQIAGATFLVDLACLGVKSANVRLFKRRRDYDRDMREKILNSQPMMPADINLVAKIIAAGLDYAEALGFSPDPAYYQARALLGSADPAASSVHVPVGGPEGKPCFVAGPYDNVPQVMAKLTRALGPGGFHFIAPLDPGAGLLTDDVIRLLPEDDADDDVDL
jgi:hypothetical protein